MKKILLLLAFVLLIVPVFAVADERNTQVQANQQTQNQGDDAQIKTHAQIENQNQAGNANALNSEQERTRARNMTELREMRAEKQQELVQKFAGQTNQNQVRLAVHTLLAMEDMEGGIGKNISAIAREFDNSVNKTVKAEVKIQRRSGIISMFMGGDTDSANEIEAEVNRNRLRIQQLEQYRNQCSCNAEVKAMIQEQIQLMEQEQTRLQQMAQAEKQKKGIFGFLKKSK